MILLLPLLACLPLKEEDTDEVVDESGAIALYDINNYSISVDLALRSDFAAEGKDVQLDWSRLDHDMRGRPVRPEQVTGVDLAWFQALEREELEAALIDGTAVQSQVTLIALWANDERRTSMPLSMLMLFLDNFDPKKYFLDVGGTWLVRLRSEEDDNAMLQVLAPRPGGALGVDIDGASAVLDLEVDLERTVPLAMAAGEIPVLDWSGLERDGRGDVVDRRVLQTLTLARYDGPLSEIEADFALADELATATWTLDVTGQSSGDTANATDPTGAPFPGFDDTGTWLVGLRCDTCLAPAPPFVGRVQIRE